MSEAHPNATRRWGLALICAAQFVLLLDFSVVNVALATIEPALHFAPAQLQWVVTGYVLTFGSLLIFGGRLGDVIGHRRLLLLSVGLFGVASLAAGLSVTSGMLIVSRMIQGVAAAFVAPTALAILTALFDDGHARARALGYYQGSGAAGGTAGIVLGGLLTQYAGWRSVFLVNPPVIVVLVLLMMRYLPDAHREPRRKPHLDIAGTSLITVALATLIFGLTEGPQYGFGSWQTISGALLFIVFATAFILVERRTEDPMIPLKVLAQPARRAALIAAACGGAMLGGYLYFLVLFLQHVLGFDALRTGLALVPSTGTVLITAMLLARRMVTRFGVRATLTVGLCTMAAGQFVLAHMSAHSSYLVDIVPGLVLAALGTGLVMPAASVAAITGSDSNIRGLVGGIFVTAQQVGPAVGLAVFVTIAAARSRAAGGNLIPGYQLSYFLAGATGLVSAAVVFLLLRGTPASATSSVVVPSEAELIARGELDEVDRDLAPIDSRCAPLERST